MFALVELWLTWGCDNIGRLVHNYILVVCRLDSTNLSKTIQNLTALGIYNHLHNFTGISSNIHGYQRLCIILKTFAIYQDLFRNLGLIIGK